MGSGAFSCRRLNPVSVWASALLLMQSTVLAADFDPSVMTLSAATLVANQPLQGEHYRIADQVINRGFMNHYTVSSDFGEFSADSDQRLRALLHELKAIDELRGLQKTDVFGEAVVSAAQKPIQTVQKIAEQPVDTLKGVPQGVGRLFKRTARQISDATKEAKRLNDERKEKSAQQDGESESDPVSGTEIVEQGAEAGIEWGKSQLGQNKSIRTLAKQLGVDPYSPNKVLQNELSEVAWVMTAGSFGAGQVVPGLPSGIDTLSDVNDLVWDTHPVDLQLRNEKSLAEMGVSEDEVKRFFSNKHYSPSLQTMVVSALEKLDRVRGRAVLVDAAVAAESRSEALAFAEIAESFADYHSRQQPAASIAGSAIWPLLETRSGTYVFFAPVDYLGWTSSVSASATSLTEDLRIRAPRHKLELRVQGGMSRLARRQLESLGWVCVASTGRSKQ